MKLVVAVVRPERLSAVLESLFRAEVRGLTLSRVSGHGGEVESVETYRGTTVKMELSEKVRLEIGVSDHFVEPTVKAILASARTGEVGDGKVFVLPVEKVYRIRTGEEDQAAVTPVACVQRPPPRLAIRARRRTDFSTLRARYESAERSVAVRAQFGNALAGRDRLSRSP